MSSSGCRVRKSFLLSAIAVTLWYLCYLLLSVTSSNVTLTLVDNNSVNQIPSAIIKDLEYDGQSPTTEKTPQKEPSPQPTSSRAELTPQMKPNTVIIEQPYTSTLNRQFNTTSYDMLHNGLVQELTRYRKESPPAPQVNVLLASWRTGSTFVGKMLASHPGSYYHYEPMHSAGMHQIRNGSGLMEEASNRLLQLAYCNISEEYVKTSRKLMYGLQSSSSWAQACAKNQHSSQWCWDRSFIKDLCQIYPYQLIKTVRVRLQALRRLLEEIPNARVVVTARDPRATKHSRRNPVFCRGRQPLCDDVGLCNDMVVDYHTAISFEALFPGRVRLLRLEDVIEEPMEQFQNLTTFYNLKFTEKMQSNIKKSMNGTAPVPQKPVVSRNKPISRQIAHRLIPKVSAHSTVRDSKYEAQQWRLEMRWTEVVKIQNECEEAMKLWGYNDAPSEDKLKTFEPIGAFISNIKL